MEPLLRDLRHGLRKRPHAQHWKVAAGLLLGLLLASGNAPLAAAAYAGNPPQKEEELPAWKRQPKDMRAASEANKHALQLIGEVFEARLQKGRVEFKFKPKIVQAETDDPLAGPNDLGASPLFQDFGQGTVWLSVILSAKPADLSPRLQEIQRGLLERLPEIASVKPAANSHPATKPAANQTVQAQGAAADEVRQILDAEQDYQQVLSGMRAAFPQYAELYSHESLRLLNPTGTPTVFELTDPAINADPLVKNERMQASLMVKVHRLSQHNFRIISFWLYRNIEDPEIFVPRTLYTDKGREATRNSVGRWDATHMPPRTFAAIAYVSPAVTVLDLRFVDGEPVVSGRSAPAGRRRAQPVDLTARQIDQMEPAAEGALDVMVPTYPVVPPTLVAMPALAMGKPRLGLDSMPRLREPYEFRSQAAYEAYLEGVREGLSALHTPVNPALDEAAAAKNAGASAVSMATVEAASKLEEEAKAIALVERLNPGFLDPRQENGLRDLSGMARASLQQYPDLQAVSARNLANQLFERANDGLARHDKAMLRMQQKLPHIRQLNVYLLASENTSADWRGPDDATGKGGIVVIVPNRYYVDPQQFYGLVAGALINELPTSEESIALANYLSATAVQRASRAKQFPVVTEYVDHGWDENGDMHKWPDEAVDFFQHLQEAINYVRPRLEAMSAERRATLEQEVAAVDDWLGSLGEGSVTVNFGLFKGKGEAPPAKADGAARTIAISFRADEYIQWQNKQNRWTLWPRLLEGFNGLKGGKFDPGLAGAAYDVLLAFAKDKDNKLMIAWRLNTDLPAKPADWPRVAGGSSGSGATSLPAPPR